MISIEALTRTYRTPAGTFAALRGVDLELAAGELVAVVGKSGSGKSTLLHLIGGIDEPTSGSVSVGGRALAGLSGNALARWRGRTVGIVFQFFQLLPTLTAVETVLLPMDFRGGIDSRDRRPRALELLSRVGVAAHADKLPATLSGGQQQRVAIARALANDPPVVLADEPTGNLDSDTAGDVLGLLKALAGAGKTVVVATHEREIGSTADRVVTLADGRIAAPPGATPRPALATARGQAR
jgi:putative ABC transport system ATP-binding protein